jgi:hypothetical protein
MAGSTRHLSQNISDVALALRSTAFGAAVLGVNGLGRLGNRVKRSVGSLTGRGVERTATTP